MGAPLIPEIFPFTVDELREAVRRWRPNRVDELVEHFVDEAARSIEQHAEWTARLRESGREPEGYMGVFNVPDQLLAYLTVISPSTAARVDAIIERRWAELRACEIEAVNRLAAERAGLIASMDDLLDDMERRGFFSWDDPNVFRGFAVSGLELPPLPEPTPEVLATAEAYVAEDIARWEALLAAARAGATLPPPQPNGIGDFGEALSEDELPGTTPDWPFIDGYIQRNDRLRQGERRLFGGLARDLPRFNGELARALRVAPEHAVPRVVVYQLLNSRELLLDSPVGAALRSVLTEDGPRMDHRDEAYLPADLLDWYEACRARYEPYPLFEDWRARKRTRRDVSFMRLMRDRFDDLFDESIVDEDEPGA
jgi:hypothetical protein